MRYLSLLFRFSLIFIIKLYKIVISPLLGKNCRYYPSCSEYAKQCLEVDPVLTAFKKIIFRLCRCNRFFKGGVDFPGPH